jgi:vacuolar-type H+-ATPase subunit H
MDDIASLSNLLVQIPLVAVFVWFVLSWSRLLQDAESKRQEDLKSFLSELRKSDHEIIMTLAREVSSLKDLVLKHDQQTERAISVMLDRTTRAKPDKQD